MERYIIKLTAALACDAIRPLSVGICSRIKYMRGRDESNCEQDGTKYQRYIK